MIKTFSYISPAPQLWQCPANIDTATPVRCELDGATGGPFSNSGYTYPAAGDHVEGDRTPVPGQNWYFAVGQGGAYSGGSGRSAGWNGGGPAGTLGGAGGAGASDIRVGDTNLSSRIAVAAGSGGLGSTSSGSTVGGDATSSAGGAGGTGSGTTAGGAGSLGQGGAGASKTDLYNTYFSLGGAGGGGLYGGGGGAARSSPSVSNRASGSGGRGWSYTGGLSGVIVKTIAGAPGGVGTTGSNTGHDGQITITYNLVPNAPTLNSPVGGRNFDLTLDLPFVWTFSDDDPDDSQTAYELQYRISGGSWVTTGKVASILGLATVAAGTFAPGDVVEWQVRTWDESDAVSTWSTSAFATACTPPATSFVFDPALTGIASRQPVITGGRSDSTPIAQYQARVVNDVAGAPGATVLADTGAKTVEAGTTALTVTLPDVAYVNSSSYHVLVKIAYPANVWQHTWTDSGPLAANIQPPPAPIVVAAFQPYDPSCPDDPDAATISIEWTNPIPDDPALAAVKVNVTDTCQGVTTPIFTDRPINSSDVYYIPAGSTKGIDHDIRVIAVTATGATASSA